MCTPHSFFDLNIAQYDVSWRIYTGVYKHVNGYQIQYVLLDGLEVGVAIIIIDLGSISTNGKYISDL